MPVVAWSLQAMLPPNRPETEAENSSQEFIDDDEGFDKILGMIM